MEMGFEARRDFSPNYFPRAVAAVHFNPVKHRGSIGHQRKIIRVRRSGRKVVCANERLALKLNFENACFGFRASGRKGLRQLRPYRNSR